MTWLPAVLWLLFAGLVIAGGGVSLVSCGVWPWGINACPTPGAATPQSIAASRNAELLAERTRLIEQANLSPQCRIPAPQETQLPADLPERQADLTCQPPLTDEVVLLVDVSSSMKWDFGADPVLIAQLQQIIADLPSAGLFQQVELMSRYELLAAQLDAAPGTDRIDVAKAALVELGRATPAGTGFKLLSFAPCGMPPVEEGTFPSGQGGDFVAAVNRLQLRSETALAQAIAALPNYTAAGRSPDQPVNIVIVTDGQDSCGGDPCAAAEQMKTALPHAQVAVVSVAQEANANACIAERSGGVFHYADDMTRVADLMRQATGQLSAEECAALSPAGGRGNDGTGNDGGTSE
ncbi:MAG: hypothetical protein JNK88_01985 [Mangrovicoccus sp.]|nr:hypothetical protein [Mangrovicoccus sp.]